MAATKSSADHFYFYNPTAEAAVGHDLGLLLVNTEEAADKDVRDQLFIFGYPL